MKPVPHPDSPWLVAGSPDGAQRNPGAASQTYDDSAGGERGPGLRCAPSRLRAARGSVIQWSMNGGDAQDTQAKAAGAVVRALITNPPKAGRPMWVYVRKTMFLKGATTLGLNKVGGIMIKAVARTEAAAVGRVREEPGVVPRAAAHNPRPGAAGLDALGVLVFAQASLPNVAGQVQNTLRRGAVRVDADGGGLLEIGRTDTGVLLIDGRMAGAIAVALGVFTPGGAARRPLPLSFGRQADCQPQDSA